MSADGTSDQPSFDERHERILHRLREQFPLSLCPEEVREVLGNRKTFGPWAIAFSGGPDSLFLLLWCRAHFSETGPMLALHFDHRTRSGENDREAVRAKEMAAEWAYPFCEGKREGAGMASEEELRRARFGFLLRAMKKADANVLLLGHQADDCVETFLGRAARGSGPEGLAAPRPVSRHRGGWSHLRVRPLLRIPAKSIRRFLREEGFQPIEDSSNQSGTYLRNRLRHQVVPAWREAEERDVAAGVGRAQAQLAEMVDFVEASARTLFPDGWESGALAIDSLVDGHRSLARFVIQRWLRSVGLSPGQPAVDSMIETVIGGKPGRWSAGPGRWIVAAGDRLFVEGSKLPMKWGPVQWAPGSELYLPGGGVLRRRAVTIDPERKERISGGKVDCGREAFLSLEEGAGCRLTVRRRGEGDRFRPLGAPGSRKLQDCLVDRKIPEAERDRLPVIAAGNRILWVPGLPPAHEARWTGDEGSLLGLTYDQSWRD